MKDKTAQQVELEETVSTETPNDSSASSKSDEREFSGKKEELVYADLLADGSVDTINVFNKVRVYKDGRKFGDTSTVSSYKKDYTNQILIKGPGKYCFEVYPAKGGKELLICSEELEVDAEYYLSLKHTANEADRAKLMNLSVFASCRYILNRKILSLINGADAPMLKTSSYEKSKLWKKLSLLTKSILNNIRTDHMRVTVTLAGIIGCTMLSISGLYMLRSVKAGFTRQFEDLQSFETVIHFDAESDAEKRILKTLSENGMTSLPVYMESAFLHASDGKMIPSCVMVADKELNEWMNFYTDQGEAVRYSEEVLLSRPYADYYDVYDDSIVTLTVNGAGKYDVEIDKVFDYYLACQQLILSAENYRKLTGRTVENNAILLAKNDVPVSETDALLRGIDGYYCVEDYKSDRYTDYEVYLNVTAGIAGMLIVLSISMALFMLLNLFVQHVNEKKREIITMKINGYSVSYVQRYIYVDTIILGVIGVVIGAILGNLLGVMNVNTLYSGISYFPQSIDVLSCLAGMGISAVFTAVMCLRALRQIGKFSILDLNKA